MAVTLTLQINQGAARDYDLQGQNLDGSIPGNFLATDTLQGTIWAGNATPPLLTPAVTWIDAPTCQFRLSLENTQSAGLGVGIYHVQATATRAGRSALVLDGMLEVLRAAGLDVALPVYTTYQDLLDHAPWIQDLYSEEAEYGFTRQQGMAREWLDEILINRYHYGDTAPMIGSPGFGLWSMFAGGVDFAPSKWIRDQLDANTLMVRGKTKECVAKRSLYYILMPQLGKAGDISYRQIAREFARSASDLVKSTRFELDLNGDGFADIIISGGSTNLR
jgi:hypothetical protein